jgi:twitching motility protein PilT
VRIEARRTFRGISLSMRLLSDDIPPLETLGLPEVCRRFADLPNGLVLFTGATGMGKSTALAAVIDLILDHRGPNLLTYEDPIEYVHQRVNRAGEQRKGYIDQIEIGAQIKSYAEGLKSALRSDPDVIMIGEMRDTDTIQETIRAADTGHLVFSTGHDQRASKTVERLVNSFPAGQSEHIRYSLAHVLRYVVSLRLIPAKGGGGRVSCAEVMMVDDGIRTMITSNKVEQLPAAIGQADPKTGMQTFELALAKLVAEGRISAQSARAQVEPEKHEQLKQMFDRFKVRG